MNAFGRVLRVSVFGESHGASLGVLLDGVPAGIVLSEADFVVDIERRRPGSVGTTARREQDVVRIESGCWNGKTTGAPLLIQFQNENVRSGDYRMFASQPRPGHADFTGGVKYFGCQDPRGGGHFSGRLTLGLVAAGVVARKIIPQVVFRANLERVGGSVDISAKVKEAVAEGDSIGGLVVCRVFGLKAGLGEPFFDGVESVLAHAVFAIPGVRGVSFGDGFAAADMRGSEHNDVYTGEGGKTRTNHSGGINGGISNGNSLEFRVAFKPTSSIAREQASWHNQQQTMAPLCISGRHDACFALRTPVVVEAVAALVLADLHLLRQGEESWPGRG